MKEKEIFLRYITLIFLIWFFSTEFFLKLIYSIFYLFLFPFFNINYSNILEIIFKSNIFEITKDCIAPSVYMLITLFLLTIHIKYKKASKLLLYSYLFFTIFNLFRIILLIFIYKIFGNGIFDTFHLIFYEGLSGFALGVILVYLIKKEKIKEPIPIFYDLKYLFSKLK